MTAVEARTALLACCAVPWWADELVSGRPYEDRARLLESADAALRRLDDGDVEEALKAHPRIGERAAGASTEAAWSRSEQSAVTHDEARFAELRAANREYEERFGQVFLICATGLDSDQVLAAIRQRLGNDDDTERRVVAEELRKIALLRLGKLLDA